MSHSTFSIRPETLGAFLPNAEYATMRKVEGMAKA